MGPVIGRGVQFSATKKYGRFLRINNALLPFFVVKSPIGLALIFRSQIILKELCFMLEKEVFAHLVFLLSAVKRFYLLYIHNDKFPKDWTFYKMHSMPPHYSFIFATDFTRILHTKL